MAVVRPVEMTSFDFRRIFPEIAMTWMMDTMRDREFDKIEKRLAQKDHQRDCPAPAPGDQISLYSRDVQRRAAASGIDVDQVYREDDEKLAHPGMSGHCLRPDELMQVVRDRTRASVAANEHLDNCSYCQNMVTLASADLRIRESLLDQLVRPDRPSVPAEWSGRGPTTWTNRLLTSVDRLAERLVRRAADALVYGGAPVVAILVLFWIVPDNVRRMTPTWTWPNAMLDRQIELAKQSGDHTLQFDLVSDKIRRDPDNPIWYRERAAISYLMGDVRHAQMDWNTSETIETMADAGLESMANQNGMPEFDTVMSQGAEDAMDAAANDDDRP